MRILIFINSMDGGGAERVTANLANYWAMKGWSVTIATLVSKSFDFYSLHPTIGRISLNLASNSKSMPYALWKNWHRVMAVRRVLLDNEPDVAIGMTTRVNVLLAVASFRLSWLCVIGSERTHPPQSNVGVVWNFLRWWTYGWLSAVTALTRESAEWLKSNTNVLRVPVIPNAVSWPIPSQVPMINPATYCSAEQKVLLAVGRLSAEKGFEWLVRTFFRLSDSEELSDWILIIVGEGPLRIDLENEIRLAGLERRIFLPGQVGNINEWYARADIFISTSHFEGFPNSLLEALASGVPAVSFDCDTGPRDIIRHDVDGWLVAPGDMEGLTDALGRLMRDAQLRKRFSGRAIEARDRFSLERISSMWEKLFEDVRT